MSLIFGIWYGEILKCFKEPDSSVFQKCIFLEKHKMVKCVFHLFSSQKLNKNPKKPKKRERSKQSKLFKVLISFNEPALSSLNIHPNYKKKN